MSKNEAGKGDLYRKVDRKNWDKNWENIFAPCKKHPKYRGINKPTATCRTCMKFWKTKNK